MFLPSLSELFLSIILFLLFEGNSLLLSLCLLLVLCLSRILSFLWPYLVAESFIATLFFSITFTGSSTKSSSITSKISFPLKLFWLSELSELFSVVKSIFSVAVPFLLEFFDDFNAPLTRNPARPPDLAIGLLVLVETKPFPFLGLEAAALNKSTIPPEALAYK